WAPLGRYKSIPLAPRVWRTMRARIPQRKDHEEARDSDAGRGGSRGRLGARAGARRVRHRHRRADLGRALLPLPVRPVLRPVLLSAHGGRAAVATAALHRAVLARQRLLVLLRRVEGLLPVRQGLPGRLAAGVADAALSGARIASRRFAVAPASISSVSPFSTTP